MIVAFRIRTGRRILDDMANVNELGGDTSCVSGASVGCARYDALEGILTPSGVRCIMNTEAEYFGFPDEDTFHEVIFTNFARVRVFKNISTLEQNVVRRLGHMWIDTGLRKRHRTTHLSVDAISHLLA
jgi:hypothetical protein